MKFPDSDFGLSLDDTVVLKNDEKTIKKKIDQIV